LAGQRAGNANHPFLKSEKFDSQTSRVMGLALKMPCLALPTGDCANDVKHAIANTDHCACPGREPIPDALCEQV
jgi:hypothetical protein